MPKFEYIKTPCVVLGIHDTWDEGEGKDDDYLIAKRPYELQFIVHQTAGIRCHQHYIQGIVLTPTEKCNRLIKELDVAFSDTSIGACDQPLSDIVLYDEILSKYGGSCETNHFMFEEAIYPIEYDHRLLKTLVTEKLPYDPDDMIEWRSDTEKLLGCVGRWDIFILTGNSD